MPIANESDLDSNARADFAFDEDPASPLEPVVEMRLPKPPSKLASLRAAEYPVLARIWEAGGDSVFDAV